MEALAPRGQRSMTFSKDLQISYLPVPKYGGATSNRSRRAGVNPILA